MYVHTHTRTWVHACTQTPISKIYCFSTATVISERVSMLHYTYIAPRYFVASLLAAHGSMTCLYQHRQVCSVQTGVIPLQNLSNNVSTHSTFYSKHSQVFVTCL